MGNFRIIIEGVGDHMQDREKKPDAKVNFHAGGPTKPDAIASTAVNVMQWHGISVTAAKIIHWPGSEGSVTDDLLTGERKKGEDI